MYLFFLVGKFVTEVHICFCLVIHAYPKQARSILIAYISPLSEVVRLK